jgi:quaternary ammonium compound-resistance protein SugE
MAWIILVIASVFEIGWVILLKSASDSRSIALYSATGVCMVASVLLLSYAMRAIPMGTAYAVWTGIGAAGAAIAGIILYGDAASLARIACLMLIIAGVIGLKLVHP